MRIQNISANLYRNNTISFTNSWWKRTKLGELKRDVVEIQTKFEAINPVEQSPEVEPPSISIEPESPEVEPPSISIEPENPEIELNANDMILSYRLADLLHRLDDKSIIFIASKGVLIKPAIK